MFYTHTFICYLNAWLFQRSGVFTATDEYQLLLWHRCLNCEIVKGVVNHIIYSAFDCEALIKPLAAPQLSESQVKSLLRWSCIPEQVLVFVDPALCCQWRFITWAGSYFYNTVLLLLISNAIIIILILIVLITLRLPVIHRMNKTNFPYWGVIWLAWPLIMQYIV